MKEKIRFIRNDEKGIQKTRFIVQSSFAMLCVWIGIEFYLFNQYLETNGAIAFYSRPPGVDGFLPISSFMSFYLFLTTAEIHMAHPAGFFIFLSIILMSLIFGKSFCSWLCPIGFISEVVGDFGEKIFKKRLKLPRWLDYPFRSFKYLLFGFLIYSVVFLMTAPALKAFLDSPYNLVSDVKMYYFFADISRTSIIVISVFFVLSIFIRSFWCRFLCPYGALLGILSLLSPNKILRNTTSCIDCGLCSKACPSFIKVDKVKTVISDECSTCLNCIDACPVKDTLQLNLLLPKKRIINIKIVAVCVVLIFMGVTGFGIITGMWQNKITKEEYLNHYKYINSYGHPTGTKEFKKLNEEVEIKNGRKNN